MSLPPFTSPCCIIIIWVLLIYLRSKNSTTTFFDIFVVMFSIGLYSLLQIVFFYSKGKALSDSMVQKAIQSLIQFDPTEKVKEFLKDSIVIDNDIYTTRKLAMDEENVNYTWRSATGSLMYMSTAMSLGAISLLYHIFAEKRCTVSRLAELAIFASMSFIILVEAYLYLNVYTRLVFIHDSEIVKVTLAELKKSMSSHLVAFWNSDTNQDMREQLRKKADFSDSVTILLKSLDALLEETTALSSVHENWPKDIIESFEKKISDLEHSLRETKKELVNLIEEPSKPAVMLTNQSQKTKNLITLDALATSIAALTAITTNTPDVDLLLQAILIEARSLSRKLEDFSKTDLFASYRSTRDVLVALSKECTSENGAVPATRFSKRLMSNLNTVVVGGLALYLLALSWNTMTIQRNYRVDFCYVVATCLGLLIFQPYFLDYVQHFKTNSSDVQMMLFSVLNS